MERTSRRPALLSAIAPIVVGCAAMAAYGPEGAAGASRWTNAISYASLGVLGPFAAPAVIFELRPPWLILVAALVLASVLRLIATTSFGNAHWIWYALGSLAWCATGVFAGSLAMGWLE